MNSYGRDLRVACRCTHPDAGAFGNPFACNPELTQGVDQNLFNGADEGAYITLPVAEIHHRIGNHLARAVISNVAATVCFVEFNPEPSQGLRGHEDVFRMPVAAHGQHVRVFHKQKVVDALAGFAF
jgi:hypothetical protein